MDVAYLTEFRHGTQIYRAMRGRHEDFDMVVGTQRPLQDSVCRLLTEADVPSAIGDVATDAHASELRQEFGSGVGAYIGVPVHLADGSLYGALCCLSREPKPELDQRDVAFVQVLAEFLAEPLAGWRTRDAARAEIEQLLDNDAILPALQPIVSLIDGRCVGVEALARFPGHGIAPELMFSRARDAGLDEQLERAAIQAALAHRHLAPDGAYLGFNVGPGGILSPGFADLLRRHAPLDGLLLEITEHVSVDEYASLVNVLAPLREEGLRLAVDDVGAGYASLRHVLRMAPDVIKIDRSLVNGIATDVAQRTIVTGIVLLSLDLGADTVAEGVETAADAAALTDLGVDMVQGYLLARPTVDPAKWRTWETPWLLPGKRPDISRRSGSRRLTS